MVVDAEWPAVCSVIAVFEGVRKVLLTPSKRNAAGRTPG